MQKGEGVFFFNSRSVRRRGKLYWALKCEFCVVSFFHIDKYISILRVYAQKIASCPFIFFCLN